MAVKKQLFWTWQGVERPVRSLKVIDAELVKNIRECDAAAKERERIRDQISLAEKRYSEAIAGFHNLTKELDEAVLARARYKARVK